MVGSSSLNALMERTDRLARSSNLTCSISGILNKPAKVNVGVVMVMVSYSSSSDRTSTSLGSTVDMPTDNLLKPR